MSSSKIIGILGSTGLISNSLQRYILDCTSFDLVVFTSRKFPSRPLSSNPRLKYCEVNDFINDQEALKGLNIHSLILVSWQGTPREPLLTTQPYDDLYALFTCLIERIIPKQVFFLSSSGAIYPSSNFAHSELDLVTPTTEYAFQKLKFESQLTSFTSALNINFRALRLSSIFGPLPTPSSLGIINTWSHNLMLKKPLVVFNTYESSLNLLDSMTASAIIVDLISCELPASPLIVASPQSITVAEIIDIFSQWSDLKPIFKPMSSLVERHLRLDITLLKTILPDTIFPSVQSMIYNCISSVASQYER